jgi:hypothetical protein
MGEIEVYRSKREQSLFQCAQMHEPMSDTPAILLEILLINLEQYYFNKSGFWV